MSLVLAGIILLGYYEYSIRKSTPIVEKLDIGMETIQDLQLHLSINPLFLFFNQLQYLPPSEENQPGLFSHFSFERGKIPGLEHRFQCNNQFTLSIADMSQNSGKTQFWAEIDGLETYRNKPKKQYKKIVYEQQQVTIDSNSNDNYEILKNYIPVNISARSAGEVWEPKVSVLETNVVSLGNNTIETIRYLFDYGNNMTNTMLFANGKLPFGLVGYESSYLKVELLDYGQTNIVLPEGIDAVIHNGSRLERGCTSCHKLQSCHEFINPPL